MFVFSISIFDSNFYRASGYRPYPSECRATALLKQRLPAPPAWMSRKAPATNPQSARLPQCEIIVYRYAANGQCSAEIGILRVDNPGLQIGLPCGVDRERTAGNCGIGGCYTCSELVRRAANERHTGR